MVLVEVKSYLLHIQKLGSTYKSLFYFSIIKSGARYPQGFVCILPKNRNDLVDLVDHRDGKKFEKRIETNTYSSIFSTIDRIKFALDLLKESLSDPYYSSDAEIKAEIEKRISLLERQLAEAKIPKVRRYF